MSLPSRVKVGEATHGWLCGQGLAEHWAWRYGIVMTMTGPIDAELDARGLLCPLPVLKARKRLSLLGDGALLMVRADDPAARVDFPHFCSEQGHTLVDQADEPDGVMRFLIRKGS